MPDFKIARRTRPNFRARVGLLILLTSAMAVLPLLAGSVGWHSVGSIPAPTWDGHVLLFHGDEGTLAITPLSDDVIRFRFTTSNSFGRDHSYAVVNRDLGALTAQTQIGTGISTLATANLKVVVKQNPLRIEILNSNGDSLDADDPERGIAFAGPSFQVAKRLRGDEQVYGFGEKNGALDKRGWVLGGYNLVMWNSDTYKYNASTDPLYVSVPFYMVTRNGQAHGIFLDNTWRSTFDVGRLRQDLLTFGAEGGDLNYYFINGPAPKQVVERYTALTGRMPMPPRWALGYNQCRYSYYPESRVRLLADTFREKKIPADVIWLDIHYQDNFKPFTWDHERFPDPAKMISDLRAQGFRVVCIVDAHPKKEVGYAPYDSGLANNCFVKNPDGTVYEGPVWPSKADKDPGNSVFPDFSRPATRVWWGDLLGGLVKDGVAGIWNDMNEPSVFVQPSGTMPDDLVFDNEGEPATSSQMHNVFGQLMSRATFEGLGKLRPNERPFVLTRASYAGGQRYAAVWPGDNTADWASLRQSIPTLLGMGLSGFSFVGCDIGGFVHAGTAELYTRWLQTGVFYPFMRSHSELGAPDKDPWSFGYDNEVINKSSVELRYQLLPEIYNVMHEASETGLPAMRPLFLEYPGDKNTATIDDEFLFGPDLLVAPVLWEDAKDRDLYLPMGNWYDYWTGKKYEGSNGVHLTVTLDSLPLFVREGAFIFRQPVVQDTDQMAGNPLRVLVAPAAESESTLYEDDGASLDYKSGDFMTRRFHQASDKSTTSIDVGAPEGKYRPAARDLILETWAGHAPQSVTGPDGELSKIKAADFSNSPGGWSYQDGLLRVKSPDRFAAEQFKITY